MLRRFVFSLLCMCCISSVSAADDFVSFQSQKGNVPAAKGIVQVDAADYPGIRRAANNLIEDMKAVCGQQLQVIAGSLDKSKTIQKYIADKKLTKELKGKVEKFIISVEDNQIVIAGSDKRGTIYGIYELSRQLGVSPWYWWADMPITKRSEIYLTPGLYTDGEPVVRYRGIFLNDEAPCLSRWVNEKFPDSECAQADPKLARGFNHNFYEKVFELLQRLKANYMWPAMWGNAFYADDLENSTLADEMGIMMGTSHHEPMARNHQEWARHREENGPWDYEANQEVIDQFFREGIRRAKSNEDIITIGMRGDGDAAMGGKEGHDDEFVNQDEKYIKLYEKIFKNQRQIIKEETGKAPEKRQQVWALYKEVQRYYDLGLTVPEDVIVLLCDDNWGNIRRVPTVAHKGGYGMYYHVDYVGAPRNTKWANVTPAAHLWEQMQLCRQYGIDKLWILNVGDLKPMEYPIQLFLDMAWNPEKYADPKSLMEHAELFCNGIFGNNEQALKAGYAKQAADYLTRYTKFNGRVTPEMLTAKTYNLQAGEWEKVVSEYKALEADAYYTKRAMENMGLGYESYWSYNQLILYPIYSMCNLYQMYYAQACGDQEKVNFHFERDKSLTNWYHSWNNNKWNHMMDQTHIGYYSWQEPRENICPKVGEDRPRAPWLKDEKPADSSVKVEEKPSASVFTSGGYISIEAEHYSSTNSQEGEWLTIPNYGRTLSGVAHWPYTASTEGADINYQFELPAGINQVKVHIITNSTLPFLRREGHRYTVAIDGGQPVEVNYNGDLTEDNQWHMYDVVATRVIEKVVEINVNNKANVHTLTIAPIEPGMVLEKIVIDYGGYQRQHLFGTETAQKVQK